MKKIAFKNVYDEVGSQQFDMVRLSRSKEAVGLCSNTIRTYHKCGLPLYGKGHAIYFSVSELEVFLREHKKPAVNQTKETVP